MSARFVPGTKYTVQVTIDRTLVQRFAELSGDSNAIHTDEQTARLYGHPKPVAHGAILVALISRLIGTQIPGVGAIWLDQQVEWLLPVLVGDTVSVEAVVENMSQGTGVMTLATAATNQRGDVVMQGRAHIKVGVAMANEQIGDETKVALVTGGSRGIGAAIAERLGVDGFSVVVNYLRDSVAAEATVGRIAAAGGSARALQADVGDPGHVARLLEQVQESWGPVSVLIHAATPVLESVPAVEVQRAQAEAYWRVFMGGAIELARRTAPGMSRLHFGRMVFLGTSAMTGPPPQGWSAYLSAKHALWGYVRSLAQELGPAGITANLVSPGLTITELTASVSARAKEVEARRNPRRRLATPEDSAALIAFLVRAEAGFVNGANLPVTGGLL